MGGAVVAAIIGTLSVLGGLAISVEWDTPTGPSIVVFATIVFLVSNIVMWINRRRRLSPPPARQQATGFKHPFGDGTYYPASRKINSNSTSQKN